jgi:putative RecB family exonuclease
MRAGCRDNSTGAHPFRRLAAVSFPVPTSLSPSRVEAFTSCPMAFRFASIERIPEPPSIHASKGSFVHRVLEVLFTRPAAGRTPEAAREAFDVARAEYEVHPDVTLLGLDEAANEAFFTDGWSLVEGYLRMEDPTTVRDIGLELRLEAPVGDLSVRGIIDRLEIDADDRLVITDYKTGRPPGPQYEQSKMGGVHIYSFLCEAVLGQRPAAVRLMYVRTGDVITATPSAESIRFITTRTTAVWKAVARACETGDFRPRQGPLCNSCSYKPWCPAFGGDPERAAVEAPVAFGLSAPR